jgi:hypothetical protein
MPYLFSGRSVASAGQIGDMFGMANSLFSGFAFTVAIMAFVLQIKQMRVAGEHHLEESKLKAEEMRLANENVRLQKEMRDDEKRKIQLDVLMHLKRDLLKYSQSVSVFSTTHALNQVNLNTIHDASGSFLEIGSHVLLLEMTFGTAASPLTTAVLQLLAQGGDWFRQAADGEEEIKKSLLKRIGEMDKPIRELWMTCGIKSVE